MLDPGGCRATRSQASHPGVEDFDSRGVEIPHVSGGAHRTGRTTNCGDLRVGCADRKPDTLALDQDLGVLGSSDIVESEQGTRGAVRLDRRGYRFVKVDLAATIWEPANSGE